MVSVLHKVCQVNVSVFKTSYYSFILGFFQFQRTTQKDKSMTQFTEARNAQLHMKTSQTEHVQRF